MGCALGEGSDCALEAADAGGDGGIDGDDDGDAQGDADQAEECFEPVFAEMAGRELGEEADHLVTSTAAAPSTATTRPSASRMRSSQRAAAWSEWLAMTTVTPNSR